jgi:Secretion system C-terminal sorting domain
MQMQKVADDIVLGVKTEGSYTQKLELSHLNQGVYLISIVTTGKKAIKKLVISK